MLFDQFIELLIHYLLFCQVILTDLSDCLSLFLVDGLIRCKVGVVECHNEEVHEKVLAVWGFAVCKEHQLNDLVLISILSSTFQSH